MQSPCFEHRTHSNYTYMCLHSQPTRRVAHSPREKSLKRQAAELLLASRYTPVARTPHHTSHGTHLHHHNHHPGHCHSFSSTTIPLSASAAAVSLQQQQHSASSTPSPVDGQQQRQKPKPFSSVVALAASLSQESTRFNQQARSPATPASATTPSHPSTPVHAVNVNVAACPSTCSCKNGPGWCQFEVSCRDTTQGQVRGVETENVRGESSTSSYL